MKSHIIQALGNLRWTNDGVLPANLLDSVSVFGGKE